ncbi:YcgL domain-containing protein [Photobacterium sp. OFAV2-7]|uniref:YcgL domain-containing protein n=1 Tax=Photobacterium sp. OFAV2-7 TaxID=2917748 RepID=UPI001EF71F00|nr:YcgL domain-containing protein [Photobacterium sp. OFAV2-7]MCG7586383.1 YcgL domain-containing protein [Photobacterium sp. OFAV2-7]
MFCAIYKSPKKENTYLYINTKDDFSDVPESLMTTFGTPQFVMVLKLDNGRKLALADVEKVKEALATVGYYLQVPPPVTNLLEKYKADKVGKDAKG